MRRPVLAIALLLLTPVAFAQVYKWTDARGTVHYSESPPPQGTKFKKIQTRSSADPSAPAPRAAAEAPTDGNMEPAPPPVPVADTPENRAKLCASLKSNLTTLQGNGPVVMEQGGQPKALNAAERKQQAATAQAQYDQYCQK